MDEMEVASSRSSSEVLFLSAVPDIEHAVRLIARRRGLPANEAEDLASDVRLRLIEDDYAALRRFDGRSSLRTYIVTVAHRILVDRRRQEWGRWRPSAEAIARGPVAVRMEELLYRDGLTMNEAVETLRTNLALPASRDELMQVAYAIPRRSIRPRMSRLDPAMNIVRDDGTPESQVDRRVTAEHVQRVITAFVQALPAIDRLVLRLRFEDEVSVADIARTLRLDQKKLYRRIDELLLALRRALEAEGLGWSDLKELVESGKCHIRIPVIDVAEKDRDRPSHRRAER